MNLPSSPQAPLQSPTLAIYNTACNQLLDTLRATSKIAGEDAYMSAISESLVSLIAVFNTVSSVSVAYLLSGYR